MTRDFHLAEDVFQEICVKAVGRATDLSMVSIWWLRGGDLKKEAPMCNLFVRMWQRMGIETDKFGSSAGTLK